MYNLFLPVKKRKRFLVITITVVAVLAGFLIYKLALPPVLRNGELEIAVVDSGKVVSSIPAEGTVSPENEVFILSPASSVIQHIHVEPGSHVRKGEVILVLDPAPIEEEATRLEDQLDVIQNNLQKTRLNARNTRIDLDYNVEVKKLAIASLKSELADQEQLLQVGGISPAAFDRTKQELVLAEKDLAMIQEKNSIRLEQLEAEEQGLIIQIEIQQKALDACRKLLNEMIVRAPSDGIILAVDAREGEKVNKDRLLLTLSDLTTFKISCSINEENSGLIKTGGKVYALVDKEQLPGQIGRISPVIDQDMVDFNAYLNQSSHEKLKPNLDLSLLVVKSERDSVLRIRKGQVFSKDGNMHEVFVLRSGTAVRRMVETGLAGDEYIEIISGLSDGEQVIISEVASFRRMNEIEIKEDK
jgi:HlyD family secretion protein